MMLVGNKKKTKSAFYVQEQIFSYALISLNKIFRILKIVTCVNIVRIIM